MDLIPIIYVFFCLIIIYFLSKGIINQSQSSKTNNSSEERSKDSFSEKTLDPITNQSFKDLSNYSDSFEKKLSSFKSNIVSSQNYRIEFLDEFFSCKPESRTVLEMFGKGNLYNRIFDEIYKKIITVYFDNKIKMYDDVVLTNHYRNLSRESKKDFMDLHVLRGNEILGID